VTTYAYDVQEDWETGPYATHNNRLMSHETVQDQTVLERAWYAYNRGGNVKRIVKRWPTGAGGADPNSYYVTDLLYNIDQHLWLVRLSEWPVEGGSPVITRFRQFHYDGDSRVRFLVRDRDAASYEPTQSHWREYLGSSVYADLDVDVDGSSAITRRYPHAGGVGVSPASSNLVGWREGPFVPAASGPDIRDIYHTRDRGALPCLRRARRTIGSKNRYTPVTSSISSPVPAGTNSP
jgi:hypothetical protein